ncbi:MAG: dienelactone hydrolase family protein [Tepidiformaceae bacterium]
MFETDQYEGMLAETVSIEGNGGDFINAYFARPLGPGPVGTVVLLHHMPGWDEFYKEAARKIAYHGYAVLMPNLYARNGHGSPDDVAARVRTEGGVADDQVVGDAQASLRYLRALPYGNGKVGIMGGCSGGRQAYITACRTPGWNAVVDLWGGGVVMADKDLTEKRPVSPITYTSGLVAPLLGLFGELDKNPPVEQVAQHEAELNKQGKEYEFHIYPDAGHGFFETNRPGYRQAQAVDAWVKIFAFFERTLR